MTFSGTHVRTMRTGSYAPPQLCMFGLYVQEQDAVVAYIWAWLYCAYVKFVMCMRDVWVVQWYCIFEGLVEMRLITKMMGVVCEVVAVFL